VQIPMAAGAKSNVQTATVTHVDFLAVIWTLLWACVIRIHLIAHVLARAILIVLKALAVRELGVVFYLVRLFALRK
jgi:hypothetical protein